MTTQKFSIRKDALIAEQKRVFDEAEGLIHEFVKDVLGDEFEAWGITPSGFEIALKRDGEAVFGCGFEVRIRDDWHYDENDKFIRDVKVKMNIDTCGEFEIGANDDQEKKYKAFARTMAMLQEWGMVKYLIRFYEDVRRINREIDKCEEAENQ